MQNPASHTISKGSASHCAHRPPHSTPVVTLTTCGCSLPMWLFAPKNRMKAAWAAFQKYRQELTSKACPQCHRLRLFNMVITPTRTYASGTWTLSQTHETNDQDRTTKDASPHRPDEKTLQNKEKHKREVHKRSGRTKKKTTLLVQQTKKQETALNKVQTKTKTVMFLSKKMKTTTLKKKKTGLNSSEETQKMPIT